MIAALKRMPTEGFSRMTSPVPTGQDIRNRPVVVAVASGKGGVGKTHVSVNLSVALAKSGKRVMLFDADLGLANAGVMLGRPAGRTVRDALKDSVPLTEIVQPGPAGIGLVSGGSGDASLAVIEDDVLDGLCREFRVFEDDLDYLVIDTAAGIAPNVTSLVEKSDFAVVVLTDEPASFIDAYGLLKALAQRGRCRDVLVVTNMVPNALAGRRLFARFKQVASNFLDINLEHLGSIPHDNHVHSAAMRKRCLVEAYPLSAAGQAFNTLALDIAKRTRTEILAVPNTAFFGEERDARAG